MSAIEKIKNILENEQESSSIIQTGRILVEDYIIQNKNRDLSGREKEVIGSVLKNLFDIAEKEIEEEEWRASFDEEMRLRMNVISEYHKKYYPQSSFALNYDNKFWIPSKEEYKTMCCSDWADRLVSNYKEDFVYEEGQIINVEWKTGRHISYKYRKYSDSPMLILERVKKVENYFAKSYMVSPVNNLEDFVSFEIMERHIKGVL